MKTVFLNDQVNSSTGNCGAVEERKNMEFKEGSSFQDDFLFTDMLKSLMAMKLFSTSHKDPQASQEASNEDGNTVGKAMSLQMPTLQELRMCGKKFDHIFVHGVHELCQSHEDVWFHDLCDLHLRRGDGYFWLFSRNDELPGNLNAELGHTYEMKGENSLPPHHNRSI